MTSVPSDLRGPLEEICRSLNEFIQAEHRRPEEWVKLSNLIDASGNSPESIKDKVVMVVANIQRESSASKNTPAAPARSDAHAVIPPQLYIDLFVLFYANFSESNYPEGLSLISRTISFFQQTPWFTHANLPGLDPGIDKVAFELMNLDLAELNLLFGMMGARYLPSVYYKVRVLPVHTGAVQGEV